MPNSIRIESAFVSPVGILAVIMEDEGPLPEPEDILTDENNGRQWKLVSYAFMKAGRPAGQWSVTLAPLLHEDKPATGARLVYGF